MRRSIIALLTVVTALTCAFAADAAAAPPFEPMVTITPTSSRAVTPTGLELSLNIPQNEDPEGLATADLQGTVVELPLGMTLSPSAANGLEACTDKEIGLVTTDPVTMTNDPVQCPPGSNLGTVGIETNVLDNPNGPGSPNLTGTIFLGEQKSSDPLSGEMFRIFLVVENARYGLLFKLPGQVRVDPSTGQVTTSFEHTPQLPFTNLYLHLNGGPAASLATPAACGTFETNVTFTAYTGKVVPRSAPVTIDQGCERLGGFAPRFSSGVLNPQGGQSTPFVLTIGREDGEKELGAIKNIQLPEGLLGDIGSVPLCGDEQAANGTCPESSQVGHVQIAAGPGPNPFWVPGQGAEPTAVYLTGPYKGAPYGLSIVVPAQAGPFDLGTVVVRSALHVNDITAAITSGVDETRLIDTTGTEVLPEALPRILKGIVLNQRELRVIIDRPGFIINPTDCTERSISASLYSVEGARADVSSPFKIGNCASLGFAPQISLNLNGEGSAKKKPAKKKPAKKKPVKKKPAKKAKGAAANNVGLYGSMQRGGNPALRAVVTMPTGGGANIAAASVALPHSAFLDQAHIKTICTRVQFAEGNGHGSNCPAGSIYGHAEAASPILPYRLEGNVYLRSSSNKLPDLVPVLEGPPSEPLAIVLDGRIDSKNGGIRTSFEYIPDAPVSEFVLAMPGGSKALIENSRDLCKSTVRATVEFTGQNGKTASLRPVVVPECAPGKKAPKRHKHHPKPGGHSKSHGKA
jgi:hypothetical protein